MTGTNGYVPPALKVSPRALPEIQPSDHELVKDKLRPGLDKWCQHILDGLDATPCPHCKRSKPSRTSMNLMPKVFGVVGADVEINFNLQAAKELGVPLSEAKRLISIARSVDGVDEDAALSMMEMHLREYYARRGKRVVILDDAQELAP